MGSVSAERRDILLTGATGFLGSHLLSALLHDATTRVRCLVRAPHAAAARQRIEKSLRHYRLWQEQWAERIEVIPGDLEKPMLGLSKDMYVRLSETVAAIYHNGALVNYVLPYSKLQKANVQGTQEIIRLATKRKVPVYYVSTLRLFDSRMDGQPIKELDKVDETKTMYSGYSQSKWVSEKLLRAAGERGIPYVIFRPGLVCGDGVAGIANENDAVSRFIKGCVEMGCAPESELQVNLTPVDFVVKALVWLSRQSASNGAVFHLVNDTATPCNRVFKKLVDVGYPMKMIPYMEWVGRLREAAKSENAKHIVPLLEYFDEHLPANSRKRIFDSSYTQQRLEPSGVRCQEVDAELIQNNILGMQKTGFLPVPSRKLRIRMLLARLYLDKKFAMKRQLLAHLLCMGVLLAAALLAFNEPQVIAALLLMLCGGSVVIFARSISETHGQIHESRSAEDRI